MNSQIWLLTLGALMISTSSVQAQEIRITKSRRYVGYGLLPDYATLTTTTPSLMQCLALCIDTSGCLSASWDSLDKQCLLTDRLFLRFVYSMTEPSATTKIAILWEYEVFNVEGPNGRYSIEYLSDAETICLSLGFAIADREDLLTARAAGYNPCVCGFMSDGVMGFIMQYQNLECWGSYSTAIVYCDGMSASNVWCKFVD